MTPPRQRLLWSASSALMLMSIAVAPPLRAEERVLCVACEGPDAHYRCITGDGPAESAAGDRLACIRDIARSGGHATCAVSSRATTDCEGSEWRIGAPHDALSPAATTAAHAEPAAARDRPPGVLPAEPSAGQSGNETVVAKGVPREGAGQGDAPPTGAASGIAKAGEAVSSTAKKTWRCLTSLLSDC
ncbi:MAG: hypothetical protein AB7E80_13745 [Hyphomicrobiaceae bacterium]